MWHVFLFNNFKKTIGVTQDVTLSVLNVPLVVSTAAVHGRHLWYENAERTKVNVLEKKFLRSLLRVAQVDG